ncbi:MAG: hypothetical protein NC131_17935 [Roseburia sp.]|nr:hypothetical protein [Roseburia sp.]
MSLSDSGRPLNLQVMKVARTMKGDRIPVIDISSCERGKLEYNIESVGLINAATEKADCDLYWLYYNYYSKNTYVPEEAFEEALYYDMDSILEFKGVDIIYADVSLHLRFLINGMDKGEQHSDCILKKDSSTARAGKRIAIHIEKFKTDDRNELWEYTISM